MAKSKRDKFEKKWEKLRKRGKRRYIGSIIALVLVILTGGSFLAVLAYLQRNGLLTGIFALFEAYLEAKELDITIVVFWILAIPIVLILINIVNVVRKLKFKNYRRTWQETAKIAVEEERRAFEAKQEKLKHTQRFSGLAEAADTEEREERPSQKIRSLKELCENFRLFAAGEMHLYYTEAQIRAFVASLTVSRILILQGMSGTGKTSLAYAFGEYIGNPAAIIPVQPMWKDRSDLLGYFNEFTKKYNETQLLKKMYEANGSGDIYITVLDEMNIARVEYYFAEFLSLLEIPNPEARYLEVVPDVWEDDPPGLKEGRIHLPDNMWFIGTANNDDSTFAISDKVYDRAMIINLETRTPPFVAEGEHMAADISFEEFTALAEGARRGYEMTKRNERRLKELDSYLISKFQLTFGNRIMRQIRGYISVYVSCGGDELEALDDILCKKVFRKLALKDLSLYRREVQEIPKFLETLFGTDKMPACRDYLSHISSRQ